MQNIFYTGGNTLYKGFQERLTNEVRVVRPFQSKFNILRAKGT